MEHICPSCHCSFKQEFLCTTCGAEKLKDESTRQLERALHSKAEALMMQTNEIDQLRAELAECKQERDHWKACHATSVMMNADVSKEMSRLRKIEQAAVWACDSPQWRGDDFDNCMYALDAALKGEK